MTELERLVVAYRDAKRARHEIITRAQRAPDYVSPMDVAIANTRVTAASIVLLRYAEEKL